jgi:lipopolysaccharide/colanic/teichoic acid biosynthesis glycosyltransferase
MSYNNLSTESAVLKKNPMKPYDLIFNKERCFFEFLYIGNDERAIQHLLSQFQKGDIAPHFAEAKKMIREMNLQETRHFYDAIFIDCPLNKDELKNFCSFLKNKKGYDKSVLFYNKSRLSPDCIRYFKEFDILDDVVNINAPDINYAAKISFLRKIKNHPKRPPYLYVVKKNITNRSIIKNISRVLKRVLDIVFSLAVLIVLLPLLLIIAFFIKLGSGGPVLYTSLRAGKGYKIFKFYKFRSMVANADDKIEKLSHSNQYPLQADGPIFYKINNDPRVTKFGRFLRNSSLDELPQLFNVLRGDMSLVGNRPLPLYEASSLTTNEFVERFMATAGMTGLWQVKKRGKPEMSVEERITLDITYARKENVLYDLWIMANTPAALFQKTNV